MPRPASTVQCPWYTCADVAALLGVHERTVWQWCEAGRIPRPTRQGRRWTRWAKAAIHDLLRKWGAEPPAEDVLPLRGAAS